MKGDDTLGDIEQNIKDIVSKVLLEINNDVNNNYSKESYGVFSDMDYAIEASCIAQKELVKLDFQQRGKIIQAIRDVGCKNAEYFSRETVEETKMGNYEDKVNKNRVAALKTPGIEDLETISFTGDYGLTLVELSPFGVIGSITPTTNPTETIICNAIGMIAAGNSVVFSPHPTSKNICVKAIEIINKAIVEVGGPKNLLTTVYPPSLEQANKMMNQEKINMLCATGGPGVVKAVLSTGKKAIGAGAGNPPVIVDETANIEQAAKDIIFGCSFDNNIPCVTEKEVFVIDSVADFLIFSMERNNAFLIKDKKDIDKLVDMVLNNNFVNKDFVGKSADYILTKAGIPHNNNVKVVIMEVDAKHPFVEHELMMPLLPIVRVRNIDEAIEKAVEAEHGFRHTAIMHSKNIDNLTRFAKEIQTTIFVKNGPSYAGIGVTGEGYATFTIAGPTGEGLTSAKDFARTRRCVLKNGFHIR